MATVSRNTKQLGRQIAARVGAGLLMTLMLWLIGAVVGTANLAKYAAQPAPQASLAKEWPGSDTQSRPGQGMTLILFLHPRCPCSRASVRELDRLLAATHGQLTAIVAVLQPPGVNAGWAETDSVALARKIPGVRVVLDPRGHIAQQFGARTSGEVAVYDEQGCLAFHGGITPARGHEGDSLGRESILSLLQHDRPGAVCSATFGCPLVQASSADFSYSSPAAAPR